MEGMTMLAGIPKIGAQLLAQLLRAQPGENILIADAFFPAPSPGTRIASGEGMQVHELVDAISQILPIERVTMMDVVPGDTQGHHKGLLSSIETQLRLNGCANPAPQFVERFACYELLAQTTIPTTHEVQYGNVWLTRGQGKIKGISPLLADEEIAVLYLAGHGQFVSFMQADCNLPCPNNVPQITIPSMQDALNAILPMWAADNKMFNPHAGYCSAGILDGVLPTVNRIWNADQGFLSFETPIKVATQTELQAMLSNPRFHILCVNTEEPGDGCILLNKGLTRGLESRVTPL